MRKNIIFGLQFGIVASTPEEYGEIVMSADCAIDKDFLDTYGDYTSKMQIVAMCARVYVYKNWEKVKNWSDLRVIIEDNSKESTEYYNHIPKVAKPGGKSSMFWINGTNKLGAKRYNPVKTLNNVVLDSDGDFSLTINDKQHNWIGDDSIVIIADYVEKQLK